MTHPVRLHAGRTMLREFRPDDAEDALALVGDDKVTRWLSFDSRSLDQARDMLAGAIERAQLDPREEYYLAVTLASDDRLIGFGRLGLDGVKAGKLGFAIRADHWGNGYATDVAWRLTEFGFADLGLHRISAAIGPDNAASIAVIAKLGFVYEGTIRDHVYTNGAWRDSLLYSVLRDEWGRSAGQLQTSQRAG